MAQGRHRRHRVLRHLMRDAAVSFDVRHLDLTPCGMCGCCHATLWETPAVWIDEKGVAHTVALPNPTDVMAVDFRTSLDALVVAHRDALQEVVEDAEMSTYDMDWSELAGSEVHVGAPPPVDPLRGPVASPEDVRHAIEQVVPRWRLHAIMALENYLDD